MTTWTNTGNGGAICGGISPVAIYKATLNPPCLCCATNFFPYGWSDIPPTAEDPPIDVPQTLTFEIDMTGPESPCLTLANPMTAYPQTVTIGNTALIPGHFYGATYVFQNPLQATGGYQGTIQIFGSLLPNIYGTYWAATMTLPLGFQNIQYQCHDWRWNTASNVFPYLTGTASNNCPTFAGGPEDETLTPTNTAFPVFTYQTTHTPCLPVAGTPFNGAFIISYAVPPSVSTNNFTYDTTSGDFAGTISTGGSFTGTFDFTTGQIVVTTAGTSFTGSNGIQVEIKYDAVPYGYPASITVNSSNDSISCGCLENGNWCGAFGMRADNAIFDSTTGYKLLPHGDQTTLVFAYESGITGGGCQCSWDNDFCVWFGFPFGLVVGGSTKVATPTQPYTVVMLIQNGDGSATLQIGLAGPIIDGFQYFDGYGPPSVGQPHAYGDGSGQFSGNWTNTFQESVSFDITDFDCTCRYIEVGGGSGITLIPLRGG